MHESGLHVVFVPLEVSLLRTQPVKTFEIGVGNGVGGCASAGRAQGGASLKAGCAIGNSPEGKAAGKVQVMKPAKIASLALGTPKSVDVPAEYRLLHQYLDGRFADTVVLTFAEIEDLLGSALPDGARLRQDWWANTDADGKPSAQSRSWIHASRTAKANLVAQTVVFEREVR